VAAAPSLPLATALLAAGTLAVADFPWSEGATIEAHFTRRVVGAAARLLSRRLWEQQDWDRPASQPSTWGRLKDKATWGAALVWLCFLACFFSLCCSCLLPEALSPALLYLVSGLSLLLCAGCCLLKFKPDMVAFAVERLLYLVPPAAASALPSPHLVFSIALHSPQLYGSAKHSHLAFQVPHAAAAPALALAGWLAVHGLGLATSAASLLPLPWPAVHALLLLPRALAFGLLAAAGRLRRGHSAIIPTQFLLLWRIPI
jgi:hypothetical protein